MKPTDPPTPHRNLPLLLLQARERMLSRFRPVFNAYGLTDQQWRVLRSIHDEGPLEPRQISEICCISGPSLAGILARMEHMDLLARERFAEDQRRVRVSMTRAGGRLMREVAPRIEQVYRDLEGLLGPDAVVRLYRQLDRLLETLPPDGAAPGSP